uniref:Movement protein TGBp3 n=2 Tax=Cymbidium mosaic virus TaxID=12178 RepID=TGB3_CMVSI|nr:RecName: Full=Movement protein TGBp3; AltName: Full=9.7 kDa protein; AltName: Full=Triple gene block 3 protein; Short=TGBp3 [Cymbidium mosaic virus (strain Singapore)]AFM45304.1 triple gene block 3 [Cymbidium mosaic virus]ALJ56064.1 triple gene block 3 [Cymbidium mosaic virus]CAA44530.1 11KD ORF [Cymbidium mosaic virus]
MLGTRNIPTTSGLPLPPPSSSLSAYIFPTILAIIFAVFALVAIHITTPEPFCTIHIDGASITITNCPDPAAILNKVAIGPWRGLSYHNNLK